MLVDGRNRLEACTRAKVKPKTVMLNGEDPTAFVLSANVHRRHLNSGQRAMATAMMYPKKGRDQTPTELEFYSEYLRQARTELASNGRHRFISSRGFGEAGVLLERLSRACARRRRCHGHTISCRV